MFSYILSCKFSRKIDFHEYGIYDLANCKTYKERFKTQFTLLQYNVEIYPLKRDYKRNFTQSYQIPIKRSTKKSLKSFFVA